MPCYFKEIPLLEKDALQILMFYDDFEAANPLGSKKGIYIGCYIFYNKEHSHNLEFLFD